MGKPLPQPAYGVVSHAPGTNSVEFHVQEREILKNQERQREEAEAARRRRVTVTLDLMGRQVCSQGIHGARCLHLVLNSGLVRGRCRSLNRGWVNFSGLITWLIASKQISYMTC